MYVTLLFLMIIWIHIGVVLCTWFKPWSSLSVVALSTCIFW